MAPSKVMPVSLWLVMLFSIANAIRVLQDPDAVHFFGVSISVVAVIGAVGSVVALILVALRRVAGRSETSGRTLLR